MEILKDGKVVHTSKRAEVTVEDQAAIVTEFEIVTDKNTLVGQEKATIKVMGKTKDMAKDAEAVNLTEKATISLAPTALATGALNGAKDAYEVTAKEGRKGEVTVTVKVEGLADKTVKLQIANEERKVDASKSTISTKAVTVATGAEETFTVELKDQYGDAFTKQTVTVEGVEGATTVVAEDADKKGTYNVTVTGGAKAAKGDFTVKVGETEIGKVAVEVQAPGEVATWELTPSVNEVDVVEKDDKGIVKVELAVIAKDAKGLTVTDHGKTLVVKSGEHEVVVKDGKAKFDLDLSKAKKGDKFDFELFEKNGALTDSLDKKATITVIDTTPTLEGVTFDTEVKEVKVGDDLAALVKATAKTAEGKDAEVTVVKGDDDTTLVIKSGEFVLGTVDVQGATVSEEGTVATTTADQVTLTHFTPEGAYVSEAQYDVVTIVKLTEAKFNGGSDLIPGAEATKANATVGGVKFEAAEAGEISDADAITINIVQGEATEDKTVDASAKLEGNKLTITLGATWAGEEGSKASTPTVLQANEVQDLLTTADITAVKVADGAGEAQVTVATGELKGGTDKGADTPAKSATVTFTFSEAVELEGDFSFFVKTADAEATEVKATVELTEDNKVVATLDTDSIVKAGDVITDIKGLKAVKGTVVVEDVTVTP